MVTNPGVDTATAVVVTDSVTGGLALENVGSLAL
jgi:uncharacterized repeat protein (TIGR01451 family)